MRRHLVRNIIFLAVAAVLVAGSLIAVSMVARAQQDARMTLTGQNVPLIQHAHFLQAADLNQQLALSIGLRPNDSAGLNQALQAIYTPGSPRYHHYLTPAEFSQLYAPTSDQVQLVVSFLQSQGMTVQSIASNHLLIDATSTVAQVQQAFQVQINTYQYGNRTFYANAQPPSVPAALQALISSIGGLDNSVYYQPLTHNAPAGGQRAHSPQASASGYGPTELSTAYNSASLNSAGLQGQNQTVAIFELDGYQKADIQQYFQNYNLGTPAISNVLVDGSSGSAGQGAIEVELDIEVVGAIAPKATQLIYEGPNTTQGLNDTYNKIVTDNRAQVISTSWGLCESSTGSAELLTLDNIYKQAAAQGISIFAAAGDAGAYDCGDTNLGVDSPADDPYVTGVGGTNLQLGANNSYGSESVWSDTTNTGRGPKGDGGGGGISNTFMLPSWQTGAGVISSYSSGQPCNAPSGQYCRQVPDISADADPNSGYAVYCTVSAAGCSPSGWIVVGGTSAAAPFWAGSSALINQYLQSQNLSRFGTANPALYAVYNSQQATPAFHDVSSGNNLFYPATAGYDMASGIGSPNVTALAKDLAALSSGGGGGNPTPTPTPGGPTVTPTPVVPPPTTPTPSPSTSLIKNGGFEKGTSPWQETSNGGYELISTLNPHAGQSSAYLCGYTGCKDRIAQTFTVPRTYTALRLSYWWFSETMEISQQCLDTFTVLVQSASGQSIHTLQHSCNTNATNGWQQQTFDLTSLLSAYQGQQVSLLFTGTTKANLFLSSSFFVDDISLVAL
ncbi:MAG TPA: S53 family peptidase [Ktedonobacteraceae bacterium]